MPLSSRELLSALRRREMAAIFVLGFASGLPLLLTLSTLSWWLKVENVGLADIGLFALVGLPYALKFLWAPLLDGIPPPLLPSSPRRGWIITCQLATIGAMLWLGNSDPAENLRAVAVAALAVAFFSASQDIAVDAYRIEILDKPRQALGAAMAQFGYRLGLLYSGAGALFLSRFFTWPQVFGWMAAGLGLGILAALLAPPPADSRKKSPALAEMVALPFADFLRRRRWLWLLLFIGLYKLGDATAGVMANPFYLEMGFSAAQVATASKTFGLGCTLLGIFLGGWMASVGGVINALLVAGVLQAVSNLLFSAQAMLGDNFAFLFVTVAGENISGGIGGAAFVCFLSQLVRRPWVAAQYALLSSFMALARVSLSAPAGFIAERFSWEIFFALTALAALPGLLLLWFMRRGLAQEL